MAKALNMLTHRRWNFGKDGILWMQ
jgi:hypothetical protein